MRTCETAPIPTGTAKLDGVWQCYFLKARVRLEKTYYSVWAFDAAKNGSVFLESGP